MNPTDRLTDDISEVVLDVRGVSKTYGRGANQVRALSDVTFSIAAGGSVAIMGPSGSGKTTLLNLLAGLDHPSSGEVYVAGQRLGALRSEAATEFRRRNIGFVFQFFNLIPTMSARDNVGLPLLADGLPMRDVDCRTEEALAAVGLRDRADHRPTQLSGGEQQRCAIARALATRPRLLLADEPTGNLDSVAGEEILALLRRAVVTQRISIVMVTHSYLAASTTDRILLIRDGRLVEDAGAIRAMPDPEGTQLRVVPPRRSGL